MKDTEENCACCGKNIAEVSKNFKSLLGYDGFDRYAAVRMVLMKKNKKQR